MPKVQIIENKDNADLVDINNVEIFKEGTFNNKKYTKQDLEEAVKLYNDSKDNFVPLLKITHDEQQQTDNNKFREHFKIPFRVGNVENLRLEGNSLIGDFKNVLKPIANAIKNKLLYSHSAEFYPNVEFKGKKYSKFLYGVALLGADVPALFEAFKPYMYNFSDNQETENNTNDSFYDIIKLENQSMIECFEKDFNYYEEGLMPDVQNLPVKPTEQKEDFSVQVKALENKVLELTNKLVNSDKEKFTVLENQISILNERIKSQEVESFTLDLVKGAKITPAISDKVKVILLNADNSKKESFNFGTENKEMTQYELLKDVFSSLAVNESVKIEEQVKASKVEGTKEKFDLSKDFEIGSDEEIEAFEFWLSKKNKNSESLKASEYSNELKAFRDREKGDK